MDNAVGQDLAQQLRELFGERVRFNEPLGRHTSFRIGGPADAWVQVSSAAEILRLRELAEANGVPLVPLGGGTNVLVSDRGVRGIVMHLGPELRSMHWSANGGGTRVRVGAGVRLAKLAAEAVARGLSGLEFAEGIPGSVGGGLLMNAGAFGGEIADVLDAVTGVDPERGECRLSRSALRLGYRFAEVPQGFVVTQAEFVLQVGDPKAIRERADELRRRRTARQPTGKPNAGSIFKNPEGYFAGQLIEAVGMRGRRVGDAMVSEQHANFIVNMGGATAAEVKLLIDEITDAVWKQKAIRLVPEIKLVGDWEAGG
jgi:UDP-N-acetylmuramate dehydrogenase